MEQPTFDPGIEDPQIAKQKAAQWKCQPLDMEVIEYWGDGDPFFGGTSDDRALYEDGIIRKGSDPASWSFKKAVFQTMEEAHEAAKRIKNRRPNSVLGVSPRWH